MNAIFKKELRSYFNNMTGYIVVFFILLVTGIFSFSNNFKAGYPQFEYCLQMVSFVLVFTIPVLTMRSFAEEKHQKTDLLLYSLPMSVTRIVLGKFFAMLAIFGIPTVVMMFYPLIMSLYAPIGFLTTYTTILGYFLLGAALISIGMFLSSLTESQVIAAVLGIAALLLCYLMSSLTSLLPSTAIASFIAFTVLICLIALLVDVMTKNYWIAFFTAVIFETALLIIYLVKSSVLAGSFATFLGWLSLYDRLNNFIYNGLFDITSVIYYLTITSLFISFTVQSVEKRRWS